VLIKDNSYLSGVFLNNTVQLGENVELIDLLAASASPMDCAALLTQVKRVDLSKDVFVPPTEGGILAVIIKAIRACWTI